MKIEFKKLDNDVVVPQFVHGGVRSAVSYMTVRG